MVIAGLVFAGVASGLHVFFFVLESLRFTRPATWRRFGVRSQADADVLKPMAYNQGFYNLFLAIGCLVGIVLVAAGQTAAGGALVLFGTGVDGACGRRPGLHRARPVAGGRGAVRAGRGGIPAHGRRARGRLTRHGVGRYR